MLVFVLAGCGGSIASVGALPDAGSSSSNGTGSDAGGSTTIGSPDSGTVVTQPDAGVILTCEARVPVSHRQSGASCPQGRGPGLSTQGNDPPGSCSGDSDCTAGKNGRCLLRGFGAVSYQCSYDACFSDSDCPGTPCDCRASASDTAPNVCGTGSGCRIDSDCGPCGFCSPSESADSFCVGADYEYFCHTSKDECVDDVDCKGSSGSCNYDATKAAWTCATQCSPPPP